MLQDVAPQHRHVGSKESKAVGKEKCTMDRKDVDVEAEGDGARVRVLHDNHTTWQVKRGPFRAMTQRSGLVPRALRHRQDGRPVVK